jgi:hypothetical protein
MMDMESLVSLSLGVPHYRDLDPLNFIQWDSADPPLG